MFMYNVLSTLMIEETENLAIILFSSNYRVPCTAAIIPCLNSYELVRLLWSLEVHGSNVSSRLRYAQDLITKSW